MSYAIDLKLRARVPTPNRTVDELGKVSPDLGTLLPGLATMIKPEAVSPLFAQLYETKVRELRGQAPNESLELLAQYGGLDPATKGKPEDWVVLDFLP